MQRRNHSLSRFIVSLTCIAVLAGCKATAQPGPKQKAATDVPFQQIVLKGDNLYNGIFDISVEYGADGIGWMAYSVVKLPKNVATHVAKSNDNGKTWTYVTTVNPSEEDTVAAQRDKKVSGAWRHETPSLLFDPEDVPERRWKLFSQRYFTKEPHKKKDSLFADGWIQYKYAASPAGPWSEAIRLFGDKKTGGKIDISSLHKDLMDNVFYYEIGSIAVDGTIYLSLDASPTPDGLGKWGKRKIVLIASKDHGKTWNYVGALTDSDDAEELGYVVLTGSSLVRENNRLFLFVTPSGAKGFGKKNRAHDGTLIVEFEDIARAKLKRDHQGRLLILKNMKPTLHSGGLSDYHELNKNGGILFSQIDVSNPSKDAEFFKVFNTGMGITVP